jgi:hypothetical protein
LTQKQSERRPCIESGDPNAVLAIGRQVGNSDGEGGGVWRREGGVSDVGKSKRGGRRMERDPQRVLRAGSHFFFIVHPINGARQRPVCCSNHCCVAFAMRNGGKSTALLCGTGHGKCSVSCSGYTKNCLDGQRCPRFHLPAGLHYILFI